MLILALESSARPASVALARDGMLLAQSYQNCGLTHSATLLPMANDLLKNSGFSLDDIDVFAVAKGPGSFTGVRIGVSAAKGLSWASEKPVCGVSTLEAMAWHGLAATPGSLVCAVMDARRNEVYNALFTIEGGKPKRICADRAVALSELAGDLESKRRENIWLVGDGAALAYDFLKEGGLKNITLAPEPLRYQTAWGVAMAAVEAEPVTAQTLSPAYLRLSQAEREALKKLEGC